jgi:hypothetical protein
MDEVDGLLTFFLPLSNSDTMELLLLWDKIKVILIFCKTKQYISLSKI